MRIAFAYGRYALGGKVIDVADPLARPLTGSEWSCFVIAREMRRRGHAVTLYLPRRRPYDILEALEWAGVRLRELSFLKSERHDAVCVWNEPDLLRDVRPGTLRLCNQQLNDFWYAQPGYDEHVDIYTSPSQSHLLHLRDQTPSPGKWTVLPNGCEPELYGGPKVPGRVVYASSPDRGLHQLLPFWPEVVKRCPSAHLRVFYDLAPWFALADMSESQVAPRHVESRRRALAVRVMTDLPNVEFVGPVSRTRMARELSEAVALAYPCDPYVWTEGFSVTTLEACAAGCVPVITDADAMGELYGGACPIVPRYRIGEIDREQYVATLARVLTDAKWRKSVTVKTTALAKRYTWAAAAQTLESLTVKRAAA